MKSLIPQTAGIDVSKKALDVALYPSGKVWQVANEPQEVQKLILQLQAAQVSLVCIESTGGLERNCRRACHEAGLTIAVVNPRQVRDFAKAANRLAKTDKIDAKTLAEFAHKMEPSPTPPDAENLEKIKAFRTRRQQLLDLITEEKNRLSRAYDRDIQKLHQRTLKAFQDQLKEVEQKLEHLIQEDEALAAKQKLLTSVPGIGKKTANLLIAEVKELGQINRSQLGKLIGVAPINRDSGTLQGKRMTGGGRKQVRKGLFMATLVATKRNPVIKQFYLHLQAQGKAKMVALIASMRKLLTILNHLLKYNLPWNPQMMT